MWEPYWGWTWVSYEPWGWAPHHYGRWFVSEGVWVWWPGPISPQYRPVYAPAYVSFLGLGFGDHNWSFGRGYGYDSIGWLPVGPSEDYYPWWGDRAAYSVVNLAQLTDSANRDAPETTYQKPFPPLATSKQPAISNLQLAITSAKVRSALVIIPAENFAKGVIPAGAQPVDASALGQADIIKGTIPAVPMRESLRPVNRAVSSKPFVQWADTQSFFTRMSPAAPPQPFAQRAAAIAQMMERTDLSHSDNASRGEIKGQESREDVVSAPPKPQDAPRPGWRHFGKAAPEQHAKVTKNAPSQVSSVDSHDPRPGWHRFGDNKP
jgi:hypothetical protein